MTTMQSPSPEAPGTGTGPRRPVRVGYLVSGVVSVALAVVWALWASGTADGLTLTWLIPAVLLLAGVSGLAAMLVGSRRTSSSSSPGAPAHADPVDETRPYPTKES